MNLNDVASELPNQAPHESPLVNKDHVSVESDAVSGLESAGQPQPPNGPLSGDPADDGTHEKKKVARDGRGNGKPTPAGKPESSESPFQIRRISLRIQKLPGLSDPLQQFAKFRSELSYTAKLTSVLSTAAIHLLLLLFPIVLATAEGRQRVVAGSRTWAIAKTELHPDTKIHAIDIGLIGKKTALQLAIVDSFICGLFFCLTRGSMKALQDGYSHLNDDDREVASQLLPGATTKKDLSDLTGIREATTYDRRNPGGDISEVVEPA